MGNEPLKLLLDTHVWVWAVEDAKRLGRKSRRLLQDARRSASDFFTLFMPVTHQIAIEAYNLPEPFHRDPADRQIVACARRHELAVVTADERILRWKHVKTLDARK